MKSIKLATIIGARPQFIKMKPISSYIKKHSSIEEIVIHTGQHYDRLMSEIFFKEMKIDEPQKNLSVGSASHGKQTGEMLIKIEEALFKIRPQGVLVYGDTNSTLAGALVAAKMNVPVFHVEAGLRSYNKAMPEEINRLLTDHISSLLFAPTQTAIANLKKEGLYKNTILTGDVMLDSILMFEKEIKKMSFLFEKYKITHKNYIIATLHRAENTDNKKRLLAIINILDNIARNIKLLIPLHPRTKNALKKHNITVKNIDFIEPVSYLTMLFLEKHAKWVITDSGGIQKEAFILNTPCLTLRKETEWQETLENNMNTLVDTDEMLIKEIISKTTTPSNTENTLQIYGNGKASKKIVKAIINYFE